MARGSPPSLGLRCPHDPLPHPLDADFRHRRGRVLHPGAPIAALLARVRCGFTGVWRPDDLRPGGRPGGCLETLASPTTLPRSWARSPQVAKGATRATNSAPWIRHPIDNLPLLALSGRRLASTPVGHLRAFHATFVPYGRFSTPCNVRRSPQLGNSCPLASLPIEGRRLRLLITPDLPTAGAAPVRAS